MCSACSNDDPRPEIAGGFAMSSLVKAPVFAYWKGGKRRHYRTLLFWTRVRKAASIQGFVPVHKYGATGAAFPFARLENRATAGVRYERQGEAGATEEFLRHESHHRRIADEHCEPVEIRVSADAIIEVHGTGTRKHLLRDADGIAAAWTSRDANAVQFRCSATRARHMRAARANFAYAAFGAAAAFAIWVLLR